MKNTCDKTREGNDKHKIYDSGFLWWGDMEIGQRSRNKLAWQWV